MPCSTFVALSYPNLKNYIQQQPQQQQQQAVTQLQLPSPPLLLQKSSSNGSFSSLLAPQAAPAAIITSSSGNSSGNSGTSGSSGSGSSNRHAIPNEAVAAAAAMLKGSVPGTSQRMQPWGRLVVPYATHIHTDVQYTIMLLLLSHILIVLLCGALVPTELRVAHSISHCYL
jgi:hypothetical protein